MNAGTHSANDEIGLGDGCGADYRDACVFPYLSLEGKQLSGRDIPEGQYNQIKTLILHSSEGMLTIRNGGGPHEPETREHCIHSDLWTSGVVGDKGSALHQEWTISG